MNNDKQHPRRQISENKTRPSSPSPQRSKDAFSKLLCCMCSQGDEADGECQDKKLGEVLAEKSRAHRDTETQNPSSQTSPSGGTPEPKISGSQNNKICFHRKTTTPVPTQNGQSIASSSQTSFKTASDLEFEDARDYFSSSGAEREPDITRNEEVSKAKAEITAKTPSISPAKRMQSILKRCRCATCAGAMREIGNLESYRNSDVCDTLRQNQEGAIKLDPQLKVVEYDIRSGEVHEERIEEVNLTGVHDPIRQMRNPDVVHDANILRSRTRGKLRNLFRADRYVQVDFDQDDESYEADDEREAAEGSEEGGELNEAGEGCALEPLALGDL